MKGLSDVTNDEIREIIESIRKKTNTEIDGETVRQWSREDIDRLLAVTRRAEAEAAEEDFGEDEPEEENIYVSEDSYDNTAVPPADELSSEDGDEEEKSVPDNGGEQMNEETEEKKPDFNDIVSGAKGRLKSLAERIKNSTKNAVEMFRNSDEMPEENRYDDENGSDEEDADDFEDEEDGDMKIADFSKPKDRESSDEESTGAEEKTAYIETPGLVMKKGEKSEADPEGAPVIMSADDALANDPKTKIPTIEKMGNDIGSKIRQAHETGQMVMEGFEQESRKITEETDPEKIEEEKAERELFEKRKKKIDKFTLFGEETDPYGSEDEKERIDDLFDTHEEKPEPKTVKDFDGVEYEQTRDVRKVSKYLFAEKKKSSRRIVILSVMFVISFIISVYTAAITTVGGDRILIIFGNLIIAGAALALCNQRIIRSFQLLKKKVFNINTMISISASACFLQTFLMFVLYFFKINPVSVFGCAGVGLLLLSEINSYVVNKRTADALELCSNDNNRDELHSLETINDNKDVVELGKNIRSRSPRLRYSCRTNFPSHLIEMCMSETTVDRRARFYFLLTAAASVINLIVAWAVNKNFAVGFASFTITLTMCVPAYGPLLIGLPLRIANLKLNKSGSMISCQDAVNELYRTNGILLDSRELFDMNACEISVKEIRNIKAYTALLYAAALVIRSGGPLTGAFDQMINGNRDILPSVKTFSYEEKMGVSGWINNQKVIIGNRVMLENHSIDIPASADGEKYLMQGHQVMYLAIANKFAAMIVADYAPDRYLADYLKKLRDSGVSVLVRNCDPNVTEKMISDCFDMRLDNIKVISSASGRVFRKYNSRPKAASRAIAVHDGTAYTFVRTLCTAAMLRHAFKVSETLCAIGIAMGFLMVLVLSILNVIADLPVVFVLLMQAIIAGAFVGISRISCVNK